MPREGGVLDHVIWIFVITLYIAAHRSETLSIFFCHFFWLWCCHQQSAAVSCGVRVLLLLLLCHVLRVCCVLPLGREARALLGLEGSDTRAEVGELGLHAHELCVHLAEAAAVRGARGLDGVAGAAGGAHFGLEAGRVAGDGGEHDGAAGVDLESSDGA